jgi:large subunit ribosomal protein L22
MSHRKLNDISRQVATLPVDEAIMQLAHGDKRAGKTWVKSTLAFARDHALAKGLNAERLVVAETWVSKGRKVARVDIKGRGRMGIKHHPSARIHFVLREGKTWEQKRAEERKKVLGLVRSAGMVREDGKIRRKMNHAWGW